MTVSGDLVVRFSDGRPPRQGQGLVSASARGLTWELQSEGTGVVPWNDVTAWTAFELEEPRRFRSARRRTRLRIESEDGGVLLVLADTADAADLTRQAQHALPGGVVTRSPAV